MQRINYTDKLRNNGSSPSGQWSAENANEVKRVVNQNALIVQEQYARKTDIIKANAEYVDISGTALPQPNKSNGWTWLMGNKTYTQSNGASITIVKNRLGIASYNGSAWTLSGEIELPDNASELKEWTAGIYDIGTTRTKDGKIYRANKTTNLIPEIGSEDWDAIGGQDEKVHQALSSFLAELNHTKIKLSDYVARETIVSVTGEEFPNSNIRTITIPITDEKGVIFSGYPAVVQPQNVFEYATIIAVKNDGSVEVLELVRVVDGYRFITTADNFPDNTTSIKVSWRAGWMPLPEIYLTDGNVGSKDIDVYLANFGALKIDGEIFPDSGNAVYTLNVRGKGYASFNFKGIGTAVTVGTESEYATIIIKDVSGKIIYTHPAYSTNPQLDLKIPLPSNVDTITYCYYVGQNPRPTITLDYENSGQPDNVKNYINTQLEKQASPMKYFLNSPSLRKSDPVSTAGAPIGIITVGGEIVFDENSKYLEKVNCDGYDELYFKGYALRATDPSQYAMIMGYKEDGSFEVLRNANPTNYQNTEEITVNVTQYKTVSVVWANENLAVGLSPIVELVKKTSIPIENSIKYYIDNTTAKIDSSSLLPTDRVINMPDGFYTIDIDGALPTDISADRTITNVNVKFKLGEQVLLTLPAEMSIQGQMSVFGRKKNYSLDFFNDAGKSQKLIFGNRVSTDAYVLKAYYADSSKCAEQMACEMWHGIRTCAEYPLSRIDNQPIDINQTANELIQQEEGALFFTYGFPVRMFNGGNLLGIYNFRLKKTRNNFRINRDDKKHIFLDFDYTLPNNGWTNEMLSYTQFKHYQWEFRSPRISGYKAGDVVTDPEIMTPVNNLWKWFADVQNNQLPTANRIARANEVTNLQAWIDYYITAELVYHVDGFDNNIFFLSWDAQHFSPTIYDCDLVFGRYDQTQLLAVNGLASDGGVRGVAFWRRFKNLYLAEIKARYQELRAEKEIDLRRYEKLMHKLSSRIPAEYLKTDNEMWGYYWTGGKNSANQIINFLKHRIQFLDSVWGS